ncbi:MAG: Efflux transporter, family, subunit [Verrucomicrobiales bacterium]|nr:Efflux transporter, family, subunit [Verrucomicrobiales bacterium]
MAKKSNRTRTIVVWTIILLLLAGGGAGAYMYRKRDVVITVQTEKALRRNITETVVATGKIQPVLQVVINPEVSGEITDLPVHEGQPVKKGDLLVKIKPDNYVASRNSAEAGYKSAMAGRSQSKAQLEKAEKEYNRNKELMANNLVSASAFLDYETAFEVAKLVYETSTHQTDVAMAALERANDDLSKTTISSPINGVVTKLKSQKGERVVGTAMMAGTEIMTIADLEAMEARVDIGEIDIVLIATNQNAKLEVDSFQDKKFSGVVYELSNAANTTGANTQQEATKFQVKIAIKDKDNFRPGMSVTAYIETRSKSNVVSVPIPSVTTRLPKGSQPANKKPGPGEKVDENEKAGVGNIANLKKKETTVKPVEVVFVMEGETTKMVTVKRGISDDDYVEITEGISEGMTVVSGGYKAINKELEDGKKVKVDNEKHAPKEEKK